MRRLTNLIRQQFLGAIALGLVLAGGAYAATGGNLLLGRANEADKTTVLRNSGSGPALELKARPGTPPLKVNTTKQVAKLNASRLGGKTANQFAPASGSLNYLSADGPQVLYADGGIKTENGVLVQNTFGVPAAGRLTIMVTGNCTAVTHTVQMSVDGDSRSQSQFGNNGCSFGFTWGVNGPNTVDVDINYTQSAPGTFYASVLILFQPS